MVHQPDRAIGVAVAVMSVARKLRSHPFTDDRIVPLSQLEVTVMQCATQSPGITPGELAASVGIKPSNASAALRDLQLRGFIVRHTDPHDRRVVRVFTTEFASEQIDRVQTDRARVLRECVSEDDLSRLAETLAHLDAALDYGDGTPPS